MKLWKECQDLTERALPFIIVTMVKVRGEAPQDEGAKMLVTKEGRLEGTVGGGRVELAAIKKAQEILANDRLAPPEYLTWNLQRDIGMSCGGEVSFLFEHFHSASWQIAIFGAGHVAQALIQVLRPMNCHITCVDSREEWISKLQGIRALCLPSPKDIIKDLPPKTFFVSATMGHDHDFPVLLEIFRQHPNAPYVGCIGSEIKGIKMRKQLEEAGVSKEFIERINLPMGLPIGTNQPSEMAISIAAQLLQSRGNRP